MICSGRTRVGLVDWLVVCICTYSSVQNRKPSLSRSSCKPHASCKVRAIILSNKSDRQAQPSMFFVIAPVPGGAASWGGVSNLWHVKIERKLFLPSSEVSTPRGNSSIPPPPTTGWLYFASWDILRLYLFYVALVTHSPQKKKKEPSVLMGNSSNYSSCKWVVWQSDQVQILRSTHDGRDPVLVLPVFLCSDLPMIMHVHGRFNYHDSYIPL